MVETDFHIEEHEMTLEEVKAALEKYERKYGMTSQDFYEKWKRGETYWVAESVSWRGLYDSYQALNGKNLVLQSNNFTYEEHEMTLEEVKAELEEYERKYGMASQEFYEKWKRGETEWVDESVDWSGLFRAYRVLSGKTNHQPQEEAGQ